MFKIDVGICRDYILYYILSKYAIWLIKNGNLDTLKQGRMSIMWSKLIHNLKSKSMCALGYHKNCDPHQNNVSMLISRASRKEIN